MKKIKRICFQVHVTGERKFFGKQEKTLIDTATLSWLTKKRHGMTAIEFIATRLINLNRHLGSLRPLTLLFVVEARKTNSKKFLAAICFIKVTVKQAKSEVRDVRLG